MRHWGRLLLAGIAAVCLMGETALAQRAQPQSTGMFGTRSLGTSIQAGGGTFGGTSRAGGVGGGGGVGAGGAGGGMSGAGATGFSITGPASGVGQNANNFIGRNAQSTAATFGGGQQGQTGQTGQFGQAGRTNAGQQRGQQGMGGRGAGGQGGQQFGQQQFGGRQQGGRGTGTVMIRPVFQVAFAHPTPNPQTNVAALTEQLQRAVGTTSGEVPQVVLDGRTAILRGDVATPRDRTLAELLVALEPGVSQIQNELRVMQPPPEDSLPAPQPEQDEQPAAPNLFPEQ